MAKTKDNDVETFDFFDIDINRLDKEWINQPKMYFKYSTKLTDAKEEVERCKARIEIAGDELKETKARLDLRIRKHPKKFLGSTDKPTEAAISNRILLHSFYAKAKALIYKLTEELIIANKAVSVCYSAVNTLDHRKSALERLVSLHGQNYFSTPKPIDARSLEVTSDIEKGAARLAGKKRKKGKGRK